MVQGTIYFQSIKLFIKHFTQRIKSSIARNFSETILNILFSIERDFCYSGLNIFCYYMIVDLSMNENVTIMSSILHFLGIKKIFHILYYSDLIIKYFSKLTIENVVLNSVGSLFDHTR